MCVSHKRKAILVAYSGNSDIIKSLLEGLESDHNDTDDTLLGNGVDQSVKRLFETMDIKGIHFLICDGKFQICSVCLKLLGQPMIELMLADTVVK